MTKPSPLEFVLSMNLHRRHLSASERACLAVKLLPQVEAEARQRQRGGRGGKLLPPNLEEAKGEATERVAALVRGVSRGYVAEAKKLQQDYPDLFEKVNTGELTIPEAKVQVAERRREKIREDNRKLVKRTRPLPKNTKYQTIVIDPPWDYESEGLANHRVASVPYATMSIEQITKLPVGDLAKENAHLYFWTTNLFLPKSFALLDAWGFRYATLLTWTKPAPVLAHYFLSRTEHVIFGVKGSLPLAKRGIDTHITGERPRQHSTKPESFYQLVETCSPGPWLEMFARKTRPGWASWGAEVAG